MTADRIPTSRPGARGPLAAHLVLALCGLYIAAHVLWSHL